jgi:hypothetical protein
MAAKPAPEATTAEQIADALEMLVQVSGEVLWFLFRLACYLIPIILQIVLEIIVFLLTLLGLVRRR